MTVMAVRKGILLPALQRLLGHGRLTTTEIYHIPPNLVVEPQCLRHPLEIVQSYPHSRS
jgi:hypothetical protein